MTPTPVVLCKCAEATEKKRVAGEIRAAVCAKSAEATEKAEVNIRALVRKSETKKWSCLERVSAIRFREDKAPTFCPLRYHISLI